MTTTCSEITLDTYRDLINQLPGLITVMDQECRFLLSSEYTARAFGFPNEVMTRGITSYDLRCPAVESAGDYVRQHNYVMEHDLTLTLFDINTFSDGKKILMTKKSPFKLDGNIIGNICHCTEVHADAFARLARCLLASDRRFHPKGKIGRSYTIDVSMQDKLLTRRELDCLFYLIRGCSMKGIARQLGIGPKTVESYLERVKLKWGCRTKSALIDHAVSHGLLSYIPKHLLNQGFSYILSEEAAS